MQSFGCRQAPLCDGCLNVKEEAMSYAASTFKSNIPVSGYLENLFVGSSNQHCHINMKQTSVTGYLYKKDKVHDHIPIPEPTKISSFIQFPVPMPFHALTFTITFFGLCRKCGKVWYCDTLDMPHWHTRMKWVLPSSVRKWYSFGTTEGPGAGAHGIQFSTKGYKNFIVLTNTWGRQEQWLEYISTAIKHGEQQHQMDRQTAFAFEIDNEADDLSLHDNNAKKKTREDFEPYRNDKTNGNKKITSGSVDLIVEEVEKKDVNTTASSATARLRLSSDPGGQSNLGIRHVVSTSSLASLTKKHF